MRFLFGSIFSFALATLVGVGATYLALTPGAAFGRSAPTVLESCRDRPDASR